MQTTYQTDMDVAVLGGLADSGPHDIVSATASAAIEYGKGVAIAADGTVAKPAATGFLFGGVALYSDNKSVDNSGVAQYEQYDPVPALRKGRVWVYAEQAVDPTAAVYLRHTTNAALVPGDFRTDADTARADLVAGARWVSTTVGAGMAILEINAP